MAKLPEGYAKAFAQAKAAGERTFKLNGQTYQTMGGRTHGKSNEELRGGSTRPATAPQGSSATPTPGRASKAPSASPRPSKRPSSRRNSQDVSGDPRTRDGYNTIGASRPPAQSRTSALPPVQGPRRPARASEGGPARYSGNENLYRRTANANDLQLSIRSGQFAQGKRNNRNAAAVREMVRRDNEQRNK